MRAAARNSSGWCGKEVLCTTRCRAAAAAAGRWPVRTTEQSGCGWMGIGWEGGLGRRIKIMAGASVGGCKWPRSRAECEGSRSRADCAVLTRAGPMQGARAVECDRGTLSARRRGREVCERGVWEVSEVRRRGEQRQKRAETRARSGVVAAAGGMFVCTARARGAARERSNAQPHGMGSSRQIVLSQASLFEQRQ